jgi:hypothetical protein
MTGFWGRFKLRILLSLTLLLLLLLLRRAARRSARLRRMLHEESFVMQIGADDGGGGYFTVQDGRIRLTAGAHPSPTFAQIWKSSEVAIGALTNPDETEMLRAIEDGRCRMRGSFLVALWFNEAMKIARG